jgi:hypothetical protein
MKKIIMSVVLVTMAYACYAEKPYRERRRMRDKEGEWCGLGWDRGESRRAGRGWGRGEGWGLKERSKDIRELRRKVFKLKQFKMKAIQDNLKIDSKELAEIVEKKMHELDLSSKTFDKLRESAKNNWQRMAINRLENRFLKLQMWLKYMHEGCPRLKWEEGPREVEK